MEVTVGIRDLKARLSEYLHRVQEGNIIIITDHGKPVGRLIPDRASTKNAQTRTANLASAGLVMWDGCRLPDHVPSVVNTSGRLLSDLIVEMRR